MCMAEKVREEMRRFRKLLLMFVVMLMVAGGSTLTASANLPIPIIKPGEKLMPVKTLSWDAVLKVKVKTKYGKFKAGTKVLVLKTGSKCTIVLKNRKYKISRAYLRILNAHVTSVSEGDYNTSTKIDYANKKDRKSATRYLIWVSLDKQRVNVYTGSNRKWKLIRVMRCSTGRSAATPIGTFVIHFKEKEYQYLTNFMEFCGSGFHMWPGMYPNANQTLGRDVASHGCVRLTKKDSQWMFDNIPVGTRVVIY